MGVILILLLLIGPAWAQNYAKADSHALKAPEQASATVESLALYLRQGLFTPEDQARALYRWLTANVAYDVESFLQGTQGLDTSPETVLARRKTVCDGYSRLFEAVGRRMGLEVQRITGDARGVGGAQGHAWNAVKTTRGWLLIDATWGAGTVDVEERRYNPSFTAFYFGTDPQVLVTTHFPADPSWQLLPRPLSRAEFDATQPVKPTWSQRAHSDPVATARVEQQRPTPGAPPRSLTSFSYRGVKLVKPQAGSLKAGTVQEFHLKAPGAQRLVVITEAGLYTLPPGRLPGEFRGTVPMRSGPVKVMGDFTGGRLEGLLEYTVP